MLLYAPGFTGTSLCHLERMDGTTIGLFGRHITATLTGLFQRQ